MPLTTTQNAGVKVLADHLGLSKATVSKALNGYPQVSEATRQRVLEAAEQLGYATPENEAANRPLGGRKRIGWLYRSATREMNPGQLNASNGFQYVAQEMRDIRMEVLLLPQFQDKPAGRTLSQLVADYHLDGAFISDIQVHDLLFQEVQEVFVPLVFWGAPPIAEQANVCAVTYDSIVGIGKTMAHLLSLGHRRIGFLNGNSGAYVSQERLDGYILALTRAGVSFDPTLVWEGDYSFACGAPALDYFLQKGVTAICCASDKMAIGAAHAATQRGLSIPEDLSIVGYDDDPLCSSMFPSLTTVAQDFFRIGRVAATLMTCMLRGLPVGPVSIHPELLVRGSTAAPKHT